MQRCLESALGCLGLERAWLALLLGACRPMSREAKVDLGLRRPMGPMVVLAPRVLEHLLQMQRHLELPSVA
eukprot:9821015-Karenia_brevis.AAC.1